MKNYLKKFLIIFLSLSCLAACSAFNNESGNTDSNSKAEILKISPEKLYKKAMYDVGIEELVDKQVEIEDKIEKFDKQGANGVAAIYFRVVTKDNLIFDETDNLICIFTDKDEIKKFADLKDGQKVSIRGTVKSLMDEEISAGDWYRFNTNSNIVIENCQLKDGFFWDDKKKDKSNSKVNKKSVSKKTLKSESSHTNNVSEYILPTADSEYISVEYMKSMVTNGDTSLIRLAVNEMFARHGATFSKQKNIDYFLSKSWYNPIEGVSDEYIQENLFNEYEKANLKNLLYVESLYK